MYVYVCVYFISGTVTFTSTPLYSPRSTGTAQTLLRELVCTIMISETYTKLVVLCEGSFPPQGRTSPCVALPLLLRLENLCPEWGVSDPVLKGKMEASFIQTIREFQWYFRTHLPLSSDPLPTSCKIRGSSRTKYPPMQNKANTLNIQSFGSTPVLLIQFLEAE